MSGPSLAVGEAFGILWHDEAHREPSDFPGKSSDVQGVASDRLSQPACSRGTDLPQELSGAVEWMKRTGPARRLGFAVPDRGARGVRPFQRAVLLWHDRPVAGTARARPGGEPAARAPGNADRAAVSGPAAAAGPGARLFHRSRTRMPTMVSSPSDRQASRR